MRELKLLIIENVQNQALTYLIENDVTDVPDDKIMCDLDPENDEYDQIKFYARVQSIIISKAIEGYFRSNTLTTLRNQKEKFHWTDSRGQIFNGRPTMLKILANICNPTVRVGVETQ